MDVVDFDLFYICLQKNDIPAALQLVTRKNANTCSRIGGHGVLALLCCYGPDDPDLLRHFIELGAPIYVSNATSSRPVSALHHAALRGLHRILRVLLNLGDATLTDMPDWANRTPLYMALQTSRGYKHQKKNRDLCALLLLDAGAKVPPTEDFEVPLWVYEFLDMREKLRSGCVALVGVVLKSREHKNKKDVMRIIARCLWATRGYAHKKKKWTINMIDLF